jgi:hypothetical protein
MCVRARTFVCVRACVYVCVHAHTCVRVYTVRYVRVCVRALCTCVCVCVCVCAHTCVCAGTCVRARTWCVHVHVKGLKPTFLFGSFPREDQPPKLFVHLGGLEGQLGRLSLFVL